MRNPAVIVCFFLLTGCGVESAGTAAIVGKQQAEQARQAKESMNDIKKSLDAATNAAEQNMKKAEEAANN